MPRLAAILVAAAALLVPGCGGDDDERTAAPAARFGPQAIRGVVAVERIRARLVPVSDLTGLGRAEEASTHLADARRLWEAVEPRVAAGDAVLAREVSVAFDRTRRAVAEVGTFDAVRDVAGPLEGQLLGGVREELVPQKEARLDPGVNAAALARLLGTFEAEYTAGGRERRLHAYGLLVRSQAVARDLVDALGSRRDAVIEGLKALREAAYPDGASLPAEPAPASEVRRRVAEIRATLGRAFR